MRTMSTMSSCRRSVLGSWVGVRRLFHLSFFLTASRMVLPKILVLTVRHAWVVQPRGEACLLPATRARVGDAEGDLTACPPRPAPVRRCPCTRGGDARSRAWRAAIRAARPAKPYPLRESRLLDGHVSPCHYSHRLAPLARCPQSTPRRTRPAVIPRVLILRCILEQESSGGREHCVSLRDSEGRRATPAHASARHNTGGGRGERGRH